ACVLGDMVPQPGPPERAGYGDQASPRSNHTLEIWTLPAMSTLAVIKKTIEYGHGETCTQFEFLVDDFGVSEILGFANDRPWFGSTCFESSGSALEGAIAQLLGLSPSYNQFGTGRFVLYRCHCGCDYCGVISFQIIRSDTKVIWEDVR